ncbi:MAG: hypothetical protein PSX80_02615 [bacterium]|nr:hypothetical protein [bacterium]
MVDKLLSDPLRSYDELKKQPDGKIADHVVKHDSLFQPDDIYYVGDSKYYKSSTVYSSKAIYKQHTYAKNIIQYNVNLEIESSGSLPELRYRDPLTEGYNFTPNFFVEAFIPKSHVPSSDQALIFDTAALPRLNRHFENRLFDRDTLATLSFKLSFPFALRAYLSNDAKGRQRFRNSALQEIRKSVRQYLNDNFDFFRIRPHASVKIFVEKHFYLLTGKIYQTSEMRGEVILALAKDRRPDAARILELLTPEADLLAFSPL